LKVSNPSTGASLNAPHAEPHPAVAHHAAHHVELHGDEVLRLVLVADERLPELGDGPLERVGQSEEQQHARWRRDVQAGGDGSERAEHHAHDDAPRVLAGTEGLVDGVLVHPPGGDMGADGQADERRDHQAHAIISSSMTGTEHGGSEAAP
jgi:hypothetical protein